MESALDTGRLSSAAAAAANAGIDALLITPGPDLRYLTGYDAIALERLTCLIVRASGDPVLVAPRLEVAAAEASPLGQLGVPIQGWDETDNPYRIVASLVPDASAVALSNSMTALAVLNLREAMPDVRQVLAGDVLRELRMIKGPAEIDQLRHAGRAIDRVHEQVPELLRPGRTEREVGEDIAEAILAVGHEAVDFVIVGEWSERCKPTPRRIGSRLEVGDVVVVDIGGSLPSGYCSDSTRTYAIGHAPAEFLTYYAVLQAAQQGAVDCCASRRNRASPSIL